mmetsp:Transcript_7099/g.11159  ORF Transcript_7099/g.11159 Transcript_7099/m.11159 type:complete len:97 (-) Transcript_7099:56-346(-)
MQCLPPNVFSQSKGTDNHHHRRRHYLLFVAAFLGYGQVVGIIVLHVLFTAARGRLINIPPAVWLISSRIPTVVLMIIIAIVTVKVASTPLCWCAPR